MKTLTHVCGLCCALAWPGLLGPALGAGEATQPDDWETGNLVANGDFSRGEPGGLPDGWSAVCPNPALAPSFELVTDAQGRRILLGAGNGRSECFGFVRHKVQFSPGKTYRFRVRLRVEGLEDLNRHLVHGVFGSFNDGIFNYHKEGGSIVGESQFPVPSGAGDGEIRLYFRFSPSGKVWWEKVSIQECEPVLPRMVKVACSWGGGNLDHWSSWLDTAGRKWVDLALLPEGFNGKGPKDTEPIDGPSARLLAAKAKEWRMYTSGSFYEKRGDLVLNTAPLFDRDGRLMGSYSKVQVYEPEEDDGVTPGTELPVFTTDFGKIGILICYDSWFPETTRLLAYRGAELVLLPNAGYFMGLMPARAADNGVWMVVSSGGNPAGVWDPGGAMAGEKEADPTSGSWSTIKSYEKDDHVRMIVATVDLSRRPAPHYWGGPMRSSPGGQRVRQTLIEPIEDQIAREAKRWWED
ncbi:MAG: carbon-nitrogen hydrolase family protein [Chloroflexi bacterium]|nr:carbon-nitrogen hydrolase family protein [Chloroflexota bacterium]